MTKSFFGGDMSKAHWSVGIAYTDHGIRSKEEREANRAKLKTDRETLRNAGINDRQYFQFTTTDKKSKAAMKIKADAEAARIEKLTGVKMSVYEGCFL